MPELNKTVPAPLGSTLRIGFVGNTNNYPFMIAEAFRAMGHDVTVMVDRPESLHRPEGRYNEYTNGYPDWIIDISRTAQPDRLVLNTATQVRKDHLEKFDLLIVNGIGPALACSSRTPVFGLLTGSDLTFLANWRSIPILFRQLHGKLGTLKTLAACGLLAFTVYRQRIAIRRSFGVSFFTPGVIPEGDKILNSMSIVSPARTSFMLSDVTRITPSPPPRLRSSKLAFRVFNVARLNWKEPRPEGISALDMKGTDILLYGFAQFLARTQASAELVLVRKGMDVTATEDLVRQLKIERHIIWLQEMTQAEVFSQYQQADVVTEQLSTSFVGMGGLDAMAAGRPVIANTRAEVKDTPLGGESAVLLASTPEEVCEHLLRLYQSTDYLASVAVRSRTYVESTHSPRAAALVILKSYFRTTGKHALSTPASNNKTT